MKAQATEISDVLLITPKVYSDERGYFFESWNQKDFDTAVGRPVTFVQDNHSQSVKGVLRGLHYQSEPYAQGKLVRVVSGRVLDVAVDLREDSVTYGKHVGIELDADTSQMLWIPEGFAHGFLVLSETADFQYKTTNYYNVDAERSILWNDKALNINWQLDDLGIEPVLSAKDGCAPPLKTPPLRRA